MKNLGGVICMTFQGRSGATPDYQLSSYGSSKLKFRGPYRIPQAIDVAVLGGSATFGKFVECLPKILGASESPMDDT